MYTISYDWQDPITLIQVPYTHYFALLSEATEFMGAIIHSTLFHNQQYSHLTISHKQ